MSSTVSYNTSIWPHVVTPPIFILFFTLPPFPFRRFILTAITTILAYKCLFVPSSDIGPSPLMRFTMTSMWIHYMGWLAKMLFHHPERDYWRVGKPTREAEKM